MDRYAPISNKENGWVFRFAFTCGAVAFFSNLALGAPANGLWVFVIAFLLTFGGATFLVFKGLKLVLEANSRPQNAEVPNADKAGVCPTCGSMLDDRGRQM